MEHHPYLKLSQSPKLPSLTTFQRQYTQRSPLFPNTISSSFMAASFSSMSLSTSRITTTGLAESGRPAATAALRQKRLLFGGGDGGGRGAAALRITRSSPSTPGGISEKVSESIKKAEEACDGDAASGECAAAWDEVEELSAAASHARDRAKGSDPLENYCEDNPETDECKTYDS